MVAAYRGRAQRRRRGHRPGDATETSTPLAPSSCPCSTSCSLRAASPRAGPGTPRAPALCTTLPGQVVAPTSRATQVSLEEYAVCPYRRQSSGWNEGPSRPWKSAARSQYSASSSGIIDTLAPIATGIEDKQASTHDAGPAVPDSVRHHRLDKRLRVLPQRVQPGNVASVANHRVQAEVRGPDALLQGDVLGIAAQRPVLLPNRSAHM
eukprot:COSAG04_NODE_2953_length_3350_cov_2.014756_3_plen_208_part_00